MSIKKGAPFRSAHGPVAGLSAHTALALASDQGIDPPAAPVTAATHQADPPTSARPSDGELQPPARAHPLRHPAAAPVALGVALPLAAAEGGGHVAPPPTRLASP